MIAFFAIVGSLLGSQCLLVHAASLRALKGKVQTNYVAVEFDDQSNVITGLYADFDGKQNFQTNLLSSPMSLEVFGSKNIKIDSRAKDPAKTISEGKLKKLLLPTIHAFDGVNSISEVAEVSLNEESRQVDVSIKGQLLEDITVAGLTYGVYVNSPSVYGLFSTGVAQMMGKTHACLGSADPLTRAYFLGGGSALDVAVSTSANSSETVLISNADSKYSYQSGFQHVIFGQFPHKSKDMSLAWNANCWNVNQTTVTLSKGTTYEFTLHLTPNNYDFPAYLLKDIPATQENIPFTDLRTSLTGVYGSAAGCLQSYYNKQQGTIAPTIAHPDVGYSPDTNFFDPDNFITLSAMLYSGDAYLIQQLKEVLQRTSQTMCGIGSEAIAAYCNQARQRTKHEQMMKFTYFESHLGKERPPLLHLLPASERKVAEEKWSATNYASSSRAGQLMHHFVNLVPTYESIAGSEQLGPNVFWTMTVWKYLSVSQDYDFALAIFPYVDLSCKFVLSFIDKDLSLINAPGPLWIDVLIREQYTSDSNAIIVPFIEEMVEYYTLIDRYSSEILGQAKQFEGFVSELTATKEAIIKAYNQYLWIGQINNSTVNNTNDHFVTQLNTDMTSYRDFIDYDSNLMAVAFKIVTDEAQIARLISRVDAGPYTHVRATWCSEIPYTGDACDCYIVGGSVCGDSVVTLARIGYIDGIARKQIGDKETYQTLLLQPLQQDLINDVWLYERYDSNGTQIRTSYYFEYPSLITMFVREISYGIEVKLNEVVISPFTASQFTYNLGQNIYVQYDGSQGFVKLVSRSVTMGEDPVTHDASKLLAKKLTVHGFPANAPFVLKNSCDSSNSLKLTSDSQGVVRTEVKLVSDCSIEISRAH